MWTDEEIKRVCAYLRAQIGKPYAIGGPDSRGDWITRGKPHINDTNPTSFDCSGLSRNVIAQGRNCLGERIVLPHGTIDQVKFCIPLARAPKPLELGFADLDGSGQVDHVVIAYDGVIVIEARGKPFHRVIERPIARWEAQKGFLGWWSPPGIYLRRET